MSNPKVLREAIDQHGESLVNIIEEQLNPNQNAQPLLSQKQVELMLENHFKRVENLIQYYQDTQRNQPTHKSLPDLYQEIQERLKKLAQAFADSIKNKILENKQNILQAKDNVKDKINDSINEVKNKAINKINSSILAVNDRVKDFSSSIEEKFNTRQAEGISNLKVLKSAAGFYVGREFTDQEGTTMPYNRESEYFKTQVAAEKELESRTAKVPIQEKDEMKMTQSKSVEQSPVSKEIGELKKAVNDLSNQNKLLESRNQELQEKVKTVEKFLTSDKEIFKQFDDFLRNENQQEHQQEKTMAVSKKREQEMSL